ncbi:MAG: hypothetical protein OEO79_15345 [Gemmatimonadota bacterium]|nr:hypothetical protein [Gemmatimonadota bacterium]
MNVAPRLAAIALLILSTAACGSARPFSLASPGLDRLTQEDPYLYASPAEAMQALGSGSLSGRVTNYIETYEAELGRAEAAKGGFLNTTLSILGLVLPLSGTVAAVAISDDDQAQTVSIAAGAATTAVMAIGLLFKPQAKAAAATQCATYLESALEALRARWEPSTLAAVTGTEAEWNTYLTMRGTLEPGRRAACS